MGNFSKLINYQNSNLPNKDKTLNINYLRNNRSFYSSEELEIERYINESEELEKHSTENVLEETKDSVDEVNSNEEPESNNYEIEPGERITGDPNKKDSDTASSSMSKEDKELLELTEDPNEDSYSLSAESLRNFMTIKTHNLLGKVSMEDFYSEYENGNPANPASYHPHKEWANDVTQTLGHNTSEFLKFSGKWLGNLGINITTNLIPKLTHNLFKGIIYAFDSLAHSYFVALTTLTKYINRHVNSFSNLYSNLSDLEKSNEILLKNKTKDISHRTYDKEMLISQMVSNGSTDLLKNASSLKTFIEKTINDLGLMIKEDLVSTREIISHSNINNSDGILEFLKIPMKLTLMTPGSLPGYQTNSGLLNSFRSKIELPGNVSVIAHIPNNSDKDKNQWIESYRDSEMFLAVDKQKFKLINELPFMEPKELQKLIKQVKELCITCLNHQTFYKTLSNDKLKQKIVYKNYFENLLKREEKVSVKNSLIDLVILKNNFLDKVYLPLAVDVHDYCIRVINAYISYINKNIKALTP